MPIHQPERHRTEQSGWLRAAVLGANDGILSTASLVLGVAAAHGSHSNVLIAGIAGLVAGAMSMAAGEYVSVHSQADTEQADLERERLELRTDKTGRRTTHGPRCPWCACPRRTRHFRGAESQTGSGRVYVGWQLCDWGQLAPYRGDLGFRSESSCCRVWNLTSLPGAFGRFSGACGRRRRDARCDTRHLLGRTGYGDHGRCRSLVRHDRMSCTKEDKQML
jgi:hypothetical protein